VAADRKRTQTSTFGSSRREGHDATAFYKRFAAPNLSPDADVGSDRAIDRIVVGDARSMDQIEDATVGLVVTSPPYFAGKEYEEALGEGHVPGSYVDYLAMLRDVFAECVRTLEPGGRLAINVANLGRKPYRSLSADVITILQDELGLLLRGEIIWLKQRGASGSCAWGSFQRPSNPVLRDLSERIIVASKGRFDRALPAAVRHKKQLPSTTTISRDEFMEATTDIWEFPPESAKRVGHPAPFPVELPTRLIELYTYAGDLILDPFMGSGSTAIAALQCHRHYVGYETDPDYVAAAEQRIAAALADHTLPTNPISIEPGRSSPDIDPVVAARRSGLGARDLVAAILLQAGFSALKSNVKVSAGLDVSFSATTPDGRKVLVDVAGTVGGGRTGLRRTDVFWRTIGKASLLRQTDDRPLIVLTSDVPDFGTIQASQLHTASGEGGPIHAVLCLKDDDVVVQLANLFH
jgi:DNA modification methylase